MKLSLICIWVWFCCFNSVRCRKVPTGQRNNHHFSRSRIVGGLSASSGQWPWQAAVYILSPWDSSWTFKCGGTLIDHRWVVSAAHCFDEYEKPTILVIFGVDDLQSWSSAKRTIYVSRFINHPRYDPSTYFADISLLELKTAVIYNKYIQPAILPNSTTVVRHGHSCVVSGYGDTKGTGKEDVLNYAEVKILPHQKCESWYSESKHNISVPEDHVCAGKQRGGVDSCQGDSGGPLVCEKSHSNPTDYFLVGVTSFGEGCAKRRRPGVYTNVVTYLDWIMQNTVAARAPSPQQTTNGSVRIATTSNAPTRRSPQTTDDSVRSTTTSDRPIRKPPQTTDGLLSTATTYKGSTRKSPQTAEGSVRMTTPPIRAAQRSQQTTNGSAARIAPYFFALLAFSLLQYSVRSID